MKEVNVLKILGRNVFELRFEKNMTIQELAEKSNIFTTNCTDVDKLAEAVGMKVASRIYHTSEIITLKGMDMR